MKTLQSPFTLYDFFGYLFPGITFGLLSLPCPHFRDICSSFYSSLSFMGHNSNILFFGAVIIVTGYIAGHVVAALSSLLLERFIVEKFLKYPANNLFFREPSKKPIFFPKFCSPYSNVFQQSYKSKFETLFKIKFEHPADLFWCSFEYVALYCNEAFLRSLNFLNLYGFSRNLSMAFLLSGVLSLFLHWLFPVNTTAVIWPYTIASFILSIFMFWNYLKLLRRLNDEVFRAFYTHSILKDSIAIDENQIA